MSTSNENTNTPEAPIFEPFPEPSGYPAGWDLSGIAREDEPATAAPASDEAEG